MLENSLIKKLTSICFCEERGKEDGGKEDGGWVRGLSSIVFERRDLVQRTGFGYCFLFEVKIILQAELKKL